MVAVKPVTSFMLRGCVIACSTASVLDGVHGIVTALTAESFRE